MSLTCRVMALDEIDFPVDTRYTWRGGITSTSWTSDGTWRQHMCRTLYVDRHLSSKLHHSISHNPNRFYHAPLSPSISTAMNDPPTPCKPRLQHRAFIHLTNSKPHKLPRPCRTTTSTSGCRRAHKPRRSSCAQQNSPLDRVPTLQLAFRRVERIPTSFRHLNTAPMPTSTLRPSMGCAHKAKSSSPCSRQSG